MRGLAERTAKLAAEVGTREAGCVGHVLHAEWLEVPGVGEALCAQQVASRWGKGHGDIIEQAAAAAPGD
jgi:hypothetical protein